ncbi:MAG: hypothetical protein U0797_11845 [Gemmataceae bacterium]
MIHSINPQPSEFLYEIKYDESRVVQVRRGRLLGMAEWGEPTSIVVTPKEYIRDLHPDAVVEWMKQPAVAKKTGRDFKVLNPRGLALDLNGASFLHKAQLDCVIFSPSARTPGKVTREKRNGIETYRIDYSTKIDRAEVSVWIAPGQGYGVVAAESRDKKKQITMTIACRLKQYPVGSFWYPASVVQTISVKGDVRRKQVIEVEDARFGQAISDAAFTLKALGLKPGRQIGDETKGRSILRVWDGTKAVDPAELPAPIPDPSLSGSPRAPFLFGAVGLAALSFYCGWRVMRKSRAGLA